MSTRQCIVAAAVLATGWGTGCVQDARFDPRGCDWNLIGNWTIDGQPATPETCGDNSGGITEVQLFVWNEDDSQTWTDSQVLLFNCADSDALNTAVNNKQRCMNTGSYLRAGAYRAQWVARDSLNNILDCTGTLAFPDVIRDTVLFPTVPLFTDALDDSSSVLDLCPAPVDRDSAWP